jgi:hypothetical protein
MLRWAVNSWRFRGATQRATQAAAVALTGEAPAHARDIVLVPCWRRPEMLWHCIDNLAKAEGVEDLHVVFRPDSGYDPDTIAVIRSFAKRLGSYEIQPALQCPYRRTKLSANILFGYLHAAGAARRYIYLIEEDIMVGRDFFRWHQGVHAQAKPLFCSIAVRNHNRQVDAPDDPDCYYLSSGDYCSWGVCFDRRVIATSIATHVNRTYLSHPKRYLRRHFAGSSVGLGYVEQAGLIRRIQESSGLPIAYPGTPRAFHAGFYGRNRPGGIDGVLGERVERLQQMIYDCGAMREAALSAAYAADSEPVNLTVRAHAGLHQVPVALGS